MSTSEYYSTLCGALIGHDATSVSLALASKYICLYLLRTNTEHPSLSPSAIQQPFIVGVYTGPAAIASPATGFNIVYTQVILGDTGAHWGAV